MAETYSSEFTPEDMWYSTYSAPPLKNVNSICAEYWNNPSPPPIIVLVIGEQGSGKSVFSCQWLQKARTIWDMEVAFLMMPKRFQQFIENPSKFNPEYKGKPLDWFYRVDSLKEVKRGDFLYNDEVAFLRQSNAKMARTSEAMDLERMLMLCRQNHVASLFNTQRPLGALAAIRESMQIGVFKRQSSGLALLEKNLPPIFTAYANNLATLKDNEAVILSLSAKFMNLSKYGGIGKLTNIPAPEWWCPYVSEMWQGEQFDDQINPEKYAGSAYDAGMSVRTQLERFALRAWLRQTFPYDRLSGGDMNLIIDMLALFHVDAEKQGKQLERETKEREGSKEKYTDEGFELNILRTLPEFIELWSNSKPETLAKLRHVFGGDNCEEGTGYLLPPRTTPQGDPSMFPDAIGILRSGTYYGNQREGRFLPVNVNDGEIGIVNAKNWDWRNSDSLKTHEKMKSEIRWWERLQDKGFPEPKVILFAKHKVTQQLFIFIVPVDKAINGTYRVRYPPPQTTPTPPNLPSEHSEAKQAPRTQGGETPETRQGETG